MTVSILSGFIAWVLIVGGCFLLVVSAFGIFRFRDFWSRLHAVSVADSGGVILLIAGMMLHSGMTLATAKLVLIGVFLFITGPTASHAVANAALVSGLLPKGEIAPGVTSDEARDIGIEEYDDSGDEGETDQSSTRSEAGIG